MLAEETQKQDERIPYPEYALRVLFASFYPAVKLAVDFNYPLDTVKDMMTLALWREAKRKHSTINLISIIFGKSTRTVKALSARFNKGGYFHQSETNLMRRIEDLLRNRTMTMDELAERLPHCNEFDSTRLAIKALIREGRIEQFSEGTSTKVRYRTTGEHQNLYSEGDWEARVDALYEHLEAVTETVRRRFLSDKPGDAAARNFSFAARREDIDAFRDELFEFLREKTAELEARAAECDESELHALYLGMTKSRRYR